MGWEGGAVRPPPTCGFLPLLKKNSGNPYLKIIDFSCGVHFCRNFWKKFNNEGFGFKMLEKGHILRPF